MGQAKRRKQQGLYPTMGRPEDFIAPTGTICITLDVVGAPSQSTVMLDASKIVDIERQIRSLMPPGLHYGSICNWCAESFIDARKRGDDGPLASIGIGVLWTVLNHPRQGDVSRRTISQMLRRDGKAHVTWFYDPNHGLAISVGDGFVDLEEMMKLAPKDCITRFERLRDGEPETAH